MTNKRIRVAIVFGGRSAEHEVSLQSARNVVNAIDKTKYEPVLFAIDRQGNWFLNEDTLPLLNEESPELIKLINSAKEVAIVPSGKQGEVVQIDAGLLDGAIDVIFPVLHGPYGEDGSIQGLAKLANVPCVGSGILGSSVAMDKDIAKRLLKSADLAVADYRVLRNPKLDSKMLDEMVLQLGLPVYVKPANLGSSVGVSRAETKEEIEKAVAYAFEYDTKVLVERMVTGREIECAVLGNDVPLASSVGEIVAEGQFYSYDAKYINEDGAKLIIPAVLEESVTQKVQEVAVQAFQALECSGMARVDVFVTSDNEVIVNEVNTIPGFTKISMYPKLWAHTGIEYQELIDCLLTLAISEHEKKAKLKMTRKD